MHLRYALMKIVLAAIAINLAARHTVTLQQKRSWLSTQQTPPKVLATITLSTTCRVILASFAFGMVAWATTDVWQVFSN